MEIYIKKYGSLVRKLSRDRQREELDVIFSSPNKEYGINLLCELKIADHLDIPELRKIKITPSMITSWVQLNALDKYNFNASERDTMLQILELKGQDLLSKEVLYKYGLYTCTLASELKDVSKKELNEVYASIPIHSKNDIVLTPVEICEVLDKEPSSFLKSLVNDLETKILAGDLENNKEDLINYITNTYK